MIKKVLKFIGYLFGLFVFIFIVTIGITQSKFFKDRLREFILSNVSESIDGALYLGTIRGNFITGFSIDSLAITHGDAVFLSAGKVKLHHDPYTILGKKITIRSLTVEQPQVNFLKSKDGRWNISEIFRAEEKAPSKFDWTIAFENVKIINATFCVHDSLREVFKHHIDTTTQYLDYRHLTVNNLSTEISGVFKHNNIKLKIKDLHGYLPSTSFSLSSLSGDIVLNEENIEVKNLIVASKNSSIKIDARLKDVNIFNKLLLADFEKKQVSLKVTGSVLSLNEVKSFLPPIYFLNGTVYLDLDAKGEFGNFFVNHLNLQTFNSSLKIEGNLSNLHTPKDLFLNFKIDDARIRPSDVNQLLPYFKIPQFKNINNALIFANYVGNPLDFKTQVNIQTDAGKAQADVNLNLTDTLMKYSGNFKTFGFNLAKLLDDTTYSSNLNTSGTVEGIGTSINNLNAQVNLKIDSSKFANVKLDNSNLAIQVHDKRIEMVSLLKSDGMKSYFTANLDFTNRHLPIYNIEASVTSLNLADFLNNKHYESDLSLQATITLAGTNINNANATANLTIFPSVVGKHKFQTEEFHLTLNQSDTSNKILKIESSIADILLNGRVDFPKIPAIFSDIVSNFSEAISYRTSIPESLTVKIHSNSFDQQNPVQPFSFNYEIQSKNLTTISNIINKTPFNFEGKLKGSLTKNGAGITNLGNIEIKDFFIGSAGKGILMSEGIINYEIDSLTGSNFFEKIKLNVSSEIQKVVFNKFDLTNFKLNFDFSKSKGKLIYNANIDNSNSLNFVSEITAHQNSFEFLFPNFKFALGDYVWEQGDGFSVILNPEGLKLNNFILHRNNKEKVYIDGNLLADGKIDLVGRIENYELEGLHHILKNQNLKNPKNRVYGRVNSDIILSGSLDNPVLNMTVNVDSIFYRNSNFGELKSSFNYLDKYLDVSINFASAGWEMKPDFSISGKLPIDLSFQEGENLFPDEPLNMKIVSSGFQLSVLNPIIPVIDDLQGVLVCDMIITGTPKNPNYSGTIQLQQSRFLLLENYIYYNLSGSLISDVNKIYLSQFQLSNDKSDLADGKLNINGFFALRDYKISDFDLKATGQLLLLKETSRKKMQNMYGRLVGMVGNEGLHFKGSLTKSNISGNVIVQDANIVFPPSQSSSYEESGGIVRYVAVDDTTKLDKQTGLKHQFYSAMHDTNAKNLVGGIQTESKFLAGLTYDVTLETKGSTSIRMIFNSATSEELYAELNGQINLQRVGNRNYSIGEISISDRSYYNFFKRFEATGNLKFLGDPNNPELDIKATYSGLRKPPTLTPDSVVAEQKVTITLTISGTRLEPHLNMNITIDDKEYYEVGGDLQSDAISFLFTNKFRDDLNAREKSDIVSSLSSTAGTSIIAGATSTLLSGILTDFLKREFNFIRSAEITYHGGSIQQSADLRLSGQIFNAYWRLGGRIFDDINNANISFTLNFGDILETDKMKNLFLQLERKVDAGEYTIDKKLTNSARIYYRWSF